MPHTRSPAAAASTASRPSQNGQRRSRGRAAPGSGSSPGAGLGGRAPGGPPGAASTTDIGPVMPGGRDPLVAGHRQRVADVLPVGDVGREALAQQRLAARRVDRHATTEARLRLRVAARDDLVLAGVQDPTRVGHQLVVRHRHRPALQAGLDLRVAQQLLQGGVRLAAERELEIEGVEVDLRGGEEHAVHHDQRRAHRPPRAQLESRAQHRPAAERHRREHHHHQRRHEQIAVDHRQPGQADQHERAHADDEHRDRHADATRDEHDREQQAEHAGVEDRHLVEALEELDGGGRDLRQSALAAELLGQAARVREREQRVAGDDEVGERPDDRADRGEHRVAHALRPARGQEAPQPVQAAEQPRLGAQQPGAGEQEEDGRAAAPALGLERGGEDDERRQRGADHDPVGVVAHQREQRPERDRERVLGRRAVGVEARQRPLQRLAAPQQRVVRVVVRERREDDEPGDRAEDESGQRERGPRDRPAPARGGLVVARSRPGERRAGHGNGRSAPVYVGDATGSRLHTPYPVGARDRPRRPAPAPHPMKLIIQIPCLNEEETLPGTLADLPREVPGVDVVEWLIIDDGSTDRTVEVAREHGVDHIVRLTNNKGLAAGFQAGLDACLKLGADVIVNTDADNQYSAADIPKLVAPIVEGRADLVVGDRETDKIEHFSPLKKRLQKAGSWVVRQASDTSVPDTTSGFRAYNREAAIQVAVVSKYTYTLETIIQAGKLLVATDHVPIATNPKTRESRLFPSVSSYVRRNAVSIARIYAQYEPLKVFMTLAGLLVLAALIPWIRFVVAYIDGDGAGHVQSLIFGAVLFNAAVVLAALGIIGDLLYGQRMMVQRIFERVRRIELQLDVPPSHYEPGAAPTAQEPTTGAKAGPKPPSERDSPKTDEREALEV